jgi:holliday junction DNA helicase RuvB
VGDDPRSAGLGTPRVRFRLQFDVPALTRHVFMAGLERLLGEEGQGEKSDDEDAISRALRRMGELALAHESGAKGHASRSVYTCVIHQDQSGAAWVEDAGGRIPLSAKEVSEAIAGAAIAEVRDLVPCVAGDEIQFGERGAANPEDRDVPVSEELRAAVLARDGYKCVVCGSTRDLLAAHHLHARANGGATSLEFVVTLCGLCHGNGHEGLLKLKTDAEGRVVACDKDGEPLLKTGGAAEVLKDAPSDYPTTVIERVETATPAAESGARAPSGEIVSDSIIDSCEIASDTPREPCGQILAAPLSAQVAPADAREFALHLEWNKQRRAFSYNADLDVAADGVPAPPPDAPSNPLRPAYLSDVVGQYRAVKSVEMAIRGAFVRGEVLPHILLSGPAGLGKTTIAQAIAAELGTNLHAAVGPMIEEPHQVIMLLTRINAGDVIFIDEIHGLPVRCAECLYKALEDAFFDLLVTQGPSLRTVRLNLAPFTLIGATTLLDSIPAPFLSRFGLHEELEFYGEDELVMLVEQAGARLGVAIGRGGAAAIARRARGTPREALRLLMLARDQACSSWNSAIELRHVEDAAAGMGIDENGLRPIDRKILGLLLSAHRPMGIDAIAHSLRLDPATVRNVHEPYLMESGYVTSGPRGRQATPKAQREYAA